MFTNLNQIEVLSRKPLWYIDETGKIGYIQNVYSDAETIRVIKDDHTSIYPINEILTIIPELDTILFETQEDAIIGVSMMQERGNQDFLIQNTIQKNKHSDNRYSTSCTDSIDSGLYSYSEYDRSLIKPINIMELRYLNRDEKIKLIHGSDEVYGLTDILSDYIRFEGIEKNHHDITNERLVFDVISENNNVYIKHFWIADNGIDIGPVPLLVSPLSGYLIFTSKPNAAIYRNDVREGLTTPFTAMVGSGQTRCYNAYLRNERKAAKKEAVMSIASGVKDIATQFISLDTLIGHLADKTCPGVVKYFKKIARKHNAKKRKSAFMKKQRKLKYTTD